MGHTTKLSDYELERAVESSPDNPVDDPDEETTKAKAVTAEKKAPAKKSTAKTK